MNNSRSLRVPHIDWAVDLEMSTIIKHSGKADDAMTGNLQFEKIKANKDWEAFVLCLPELPGLHFPFNCIRT